MAKYCFSCTRSHPQRLLEGDLFQDWHENVSDSPVSVANVKNTSSFGRTNKNHKGCIEHSHGVCCNVYFHK